jgi:hypothetical protein
MALSISNVATNKPSTTGLFSLNKLTPSFGVSQTTPNGVHPIPVTQAPAQVSTAPVAGLQPPPMVSTGSAGTTGTSTGYVTTPTASKTSTTTPTATRGLFGSIASSLATGAPNTSAQNYTQQAVDYGAGSIPIAAQAKTIADEYGKRYSDLGIKGANFEAGQLTTGTSPVAEGNAAVTAQTTAAQQAALAAGERAALEGIGYQLTGQEQASNAANAGASQAYTGQTITQAGQLGAAGLVKPSPTSYGQTVFNPETGTFTGGSGNLDPQQYSSQLASAVINGSMPYDDAVSSLGYAGNAGKAFLDQAILGAGGNLTQLQAHTAGVQSVLQNLPAMQSANIAADGIKGKIITYLSANPDINTTNLAAGNTLQQWINGQQLTDPKYQTLANFLNEYTNTLAPVLGVGGDPTNLKTQIAQGFINGAASGQSIAQVLDNMQQLAAGKIADLQSGATGGGVVSSPQTGPAGGAGTIQTKAADGKSYGFYQDANGKWHAQ